jgi:hypothetical protein
MPKSYENVLTSIIIPRTPVDEQQEPALLHPAIYPLQRAAERREPGDDFSQKGG